MEWCFFEIVDEKIELLCREFHLVKIDEQGKEQVFTIKAYKDGHIGLNDKDSIPIIWE